MLEKEMGATPAPETEEILDSESKELYDALEENGKKVTIEIMNLMNRTDNLEPEDRKRVMNELNEEVLNLLERIQQAGQ